MQQNILDQVRAIASDIFSVPADHIDASSSPDSIEKWDSIEQLNLVLAVEEKFNLQLGPEEIERMRNIGAIADLISSKLHITSS